MNQFLNVALAQYPLLQHASLAAWRDHTAGWVAEAAKQGAQLLVFPEYGSLDLTGFLPDSDRRDATAMISAMQPLHDAFCETYAQAARQYGVTIVAGSFPVQDSGGRLTNRVHVFGPQGHQGWQDKMLLTRFERERTAIVPGDSLKLFAAPFGCFAVAVCYDVQFPLHVHRYAAAGAQLLAVPACTGKRAGYHRVKYGCQARALENQMPVVQTHTVGDAPWNPIADTNAGAAGCFVPPDNGLPEDGTIAVGTLNQPGWVYAAIDFGLCEQVRANGHVRNWQDWDKQNALAQAALVAQAA